VIAGAVAECSSEADAAMFKRKRVEYRRHTE
jgi:hypothetical protein